MLTLLLGTDWVANTDVVLQRITADVVQKKGNRILMVPELISHDTERRLCAAAGDTCSRFAQVLSFTRLARRVSEMAGFGAPECLDNGGRVVAMASAARQLSSKLKAYAAVETRPEFLTGLLEAVDEFKRCCITPENLRFAAANTQGSLAQKMEELALLLEAYDGICQRGMRDPRDQMTWLLEELEDSDYAANHTFYIDGFPDFSRQHMAILEHLICNCPQVTVSLNCDVPDSSALAFERAGKTAAELIRCAQHHGIACEIQHIAPQKCPMEPLHRQLLQGNIQNLPQSVVQVGRADSIYNECTLAAERVLEWVRSGVRYRDIGIVCGDMATYQSSVSMVCKRCGIPVYQSGTEDILDKSVISTVLAAMDAALGGFEQRDVLRYLKSALSPLFLSQCDELENYAMLWSISGVRWLKSWDRHPDGLNAVWTEQTETTLTRLNGLRQSVIAPLQSLRDGFRDARDLAGQVMALYEFLQDINLSSRLQVLAEEMDAAGDNRGAQIQNQLWEILLSALEQLYDVLGKTVWDTETFVRLLKLLLSQYDVGTIPPVLDAVTVGQVSAMRCQRMGYLIVLGAQEGALPKYGGSTGILTDQERTVLRELGMPLSGGGMESVQAEFAEIYGAFCGARQRVLVTCPGGQPSFVYRRLRDMAGGETQFGSGLGAALTDPMEAGAYLARFGAEEAARQLHIESDYKTITDRRDHSLGSVSREHIDSLYGHTLRLSASQIDKLADCRLAYFLKYGLKANERKTATVDPAEFGTYVHAVLEQTARRVMELGGFHQVTMEETVALAKSYSDAYIQEFFGQLDSQRLSYLFHRNSQELELVVQELWQELQESSFAPADFELAFGRQGKMPAVSVAGKTKDATLQGFVDRVDVWQENGRNYFRVVDYKTGRKDFDYCDVFNGLGLQMLLYLFALADGGEDVLGSHPVPAGVQYFPARVPLITADGLLTPEEAEAAREKALKRKGLLLHDEQVLQAMEPSDSPKRLCVTRKKDGSLSGDLADRDQLEMLKRYLFLLLGEMVDDIASGNVAPNPYTRGSSHNACTFCPYGAVCHPSQVEDRRDYKAMNAQRFWEEIEKEMKKYG